MSKKVQQLVEVIALQERTISKLQNVLSTKSRSAAKAPQGSVVIKGSSTKRDLDTTSRRRSRISTHNQATCPDLTQEVNTLRSKIDNFKLEIDKENTKETIKSEILMKQCSDKEKTIQKLQEQLIKERQEKIEAQEELAKQRLVWQKMYGELEKELETLKLDLRSFVSPNRKKLHFQNHLQ